MAHYPSVNSQLIRCAVDPNTARHQRPRIPSWEAQVKRSSHRHTLHLAGKWKADLCKHKANKPQGEVIYWDRYCQRHQWNTSLVLNHQYNKLLLLNTELDQLGYVVSDTQDIQKKGTDFGNFFHFCWRQLWEIRLILGIRVPLIPGCNLQYCQRKRNAVNKICVQRWFHCRGREERLRKKRGGLELLSILEASEKTWGGKDSMSCAGHGWGKNLDVYWVGRMSKASWWMSDTWDPTVALDKDDYCTRRQ